MGLVLLGAAVFAACVLGTLTRPANTLATLWPANALMLGLLVRCPALGRSPAGWAAGAAAYVGSALLMGDPPPLALWLSAANLAGVLAGWAYFSRLSRPAALLREQLSPLYLLCGCLLAALGAAVVGFEAAPVLFGRNPVRSFFMWFTTEFMNYMFVLPVILTMPPRGERWLPAPAGLRWGDALPAVALAVSELLAHVIGGAGSLGFGMPALLWCALRYQLFTTTVLCLVVGVVKSFTLPLGLLAYITTDLHDLASLRIALALMSLGPLAVACSQALRNELMARLVHAATHDGLTAAMSRAGFMEQAGRILQRLACDGRPVAVLMLDVDRFKEINDRHGHAAGDDVLRGLSQLLGQHLRPGELLGRLGGEEFAIVLPGLARGDAERVARRICEAVRHHAFERSDGGAPLRATISVGVVYVAQVVEAATLDGLLRQADRALYRAKGGGRDRYEMDDMALAGA